MRIKQILLIYLFWFGSPICCFCGLTDCVELAKALKSKYQVTDTASWLHQLYYALKLSKTELEKIAKGEKTDAGVSVPIAEVLVGADYKNESKYDRLHQISINKSEQEFVQDMGNESHQLVLDFFDSKAYDVIQSCLGPVQGAGVFVIPSFNHEHQVGIEVKYRKISGSDPGTINVKVIGDDNVTKVATADKSINNPATGISVPVDDFGSQPVFLNRKDPTKPVFVTAVAPKFTSSSIEISSFPTPTPPPPPSELVKLTYVFQVGSAWGFTHAPFKLSATDQVSFSASGQWGVINPQNGTQGPSGNGISAPFDYFLPGAPEGSLILWVVKENNQTTKVYWNTDDAVKTFNGPATDLAFMANDEEGNSNAGYKDNNGALTVTAVVTTHRKDLGNFAKYLKVEDVNPGS
jgi:hypothetical protein